MARGNGTFLVAHPLAIYLMMHKIRLKQFLLGMIFLIIFLAIGSYINAARYGKGLSYLIDQAESYGLDTLSSSAILVLFVPVLAYACLPIVNLNLKLENVPDVSFVYYLLQGILPSVVRGLVFSDDNYGLLIDPAHNVSSFFDPIIRDLGAVFSFSFLIYFYFVILLIYQAAKKGHQFLYFLYPCIFASTLLFFFSMYFLLLVVLLYPIPVYFWNRKINQIAKE